jgi:hypothetical protein
LRLDAAPGDGWRQSCTGHSDKLDTTVRTEGRTTFVGPADVEVAGARLPAYRYRIRRTLSGSQEGTEHVEVWYSAGNGLPLRMRRDIEVETPSPVGHISYAEHGTLRLVALTPQR